MKLAGMKQLKPKDRLYWYEPEINDRVQGEVVQVTEEAVDIKWDDMSEPVRYLFTKYDELKFATKQ